MENKTFDYQQARAYASNYGLWTGLMWICSFYCSMYSYDHPALGNVGNIIGILSLFLLIRSERAYRANIEHMNFFQCAWMAFVTCLYASLLTTLSQAVYFIYLDNGHLITSLTNLFAREEYKEMMRQMMPDLKLDDMLKMFQELTISDFIIQMITINTFITLFFTIVTGIFASRGKVDKTTTN